MKLYCIVRSNNGSYQMSDLKTEKGYLRRIGTNYKSIEFIRCFPKDYYGTEPYKTIEK